MDRHDVERLIKDHSVETVKIGTPDIDGVYRGKRVSAKHRLEASAGWSVALSSALRAVEPRC